MIPWQRLLQEASGYMELGMLREAGAAFEQMQPEDKARLQVLHGKVSLYMAAKDWTAGMELARHLVTVQPEEAGSWISLAYCTRRAESLEKAEEILRRGLAAHPTEAMIRYNLACYACVASRLEEARVLLKEAILLVPQVRAMALEDEDLRPLWDQVSDLCPD